MNDVLDDLRAAADYQIRMSGSASDYLLEAENEIKRLRAEVERLRGDMPVAESLRVNAKCAEIERDEARAVVWNQAKENADLRAEVERLQGLLRSFNRNEAEHVSRRIRERNELLDELERLRAFNINAARETLEAVGKAADDAREEMRAEVERLRASLRECACACSSIRECESECSKADYCLHLNARKALEAKP